MSENVSLALNLASSILAVIFLVVLIFTWKKTSNATAALKAFLCFLLVCVNIPLGMSGKPLSWLLVGLWTLVLAINLAILAR